MKQENFDKQLDALVKLTRSPRGKYGAEQGWKKLENRLFGGSTHSNAWWVRTFIGVAAAVIIGLLIYLPWMNEEQVLMLHYRTTAEVKRITLPDQSVVMLNRYSTLDVPERFTEHERKVALSGEAYFEVTKDRKHPFIVQSGSMKVQVLGTKFNVEVYKRDAHIRTILYEGAVALSSEKSAQSLLMKPGDAVLFNKSTGSLVKDTTFRMDDAGKWMSQILTFHHQPLAEIARVLSNHYDTTIVVTDTSLQAYRMTATFQGNETLESVLHLLGETGDFRFYEKNNVIYLTIH